MALEWRGIVEHARRWAAVTREQLPDDPLERRDAAFIAEETPVLGGICDTWYAPDISGIDNLPPGRALIVGTHNGGFMAPDMFSLMVGFWRHFGAARAAYGLAHDAVFGLPFFGRWIAKLGGVPASQENARKLLEKDVSVLVYPGGDMDSYKPFRERHVVKFGTRMGFVKLALRAGAPIVPVVSVGAHEVIYVLSDGGSLARRLGLKRRFRMDVLPIVLALPFGLAIGPFAPYVPMPTKIRVRVLPPIALGEPPEAAERPEVVERLFEHVRQVMQAGVDELVAEGGFGVAARLLG